MEMDKESKKKLKEAYKNKTVTGGIYSITNTITEKKYIYMTRDLAGSKNRFEFAKVSNTCVNITLSKEWEIYGGDAFTFKILETLDREPEQTDKEFQDDLALLLNIWKEKVK